MIRRLARAVVRTWLIKTDPIRYARSIGVSIGTGCRLLDVGVHTFGSEPFLVTLGNHVTVTSGVRFVTHDGGVWLFRESDPTIDVIAPIRLGNNVFLGLNVIVLPGVTIGNDCVIGAGAVVTRSVPDGVVAAGVPARTISTVQEYHSRIQSKCIHVRQLAPSVKRSLLESTFRVGPAK